MLLSVVAFRLARLGVREHQRFLDDFLVIKPERLAALAARLTAEGVFRAFGLVVNSQKTEGPAQRLAFLGVMLDSVKQTLECTPERVNELRSLLQSARDSRSIPLSQLSTLIGKLLFATQVLPGARPVEEVPGIHHHPDAGDAGARDGRARRDDVIDRERRQELDAHR